MPRYHQWLNCPATGGGSLSLKLLDYTFVRLGEKFRTSVKHSIPPCTRKVCFCSSFVCGARLLKSWNKSNGAFKQAQYPRDLRVKWGGSKIRRGGLSSEVGISNQRWGSGDPRYPSQFNYWISHRCSCAIQDTNGSFNFSVLKPSKHKAANQAIFYILWL